MNIEPISMAKKKAEQLFQEYREAVRNGSETEETDRKIMAAYKQLSEGHKLLDLLEAFKKTGLDEEGRPKLAIARADAETLYLRPHERWYSIGKDEEGVDRFRFTVSEMDNLHATRLYISIPTNIFGNDATPTTDYFKAIVPIIPPKHRPKFKLHNYHIFFEPNWEYEPPVDPILLRRISKYTFAILTKWDLTEVERMVLGR